MYCVLCTVYCVLCTVYCVLCTVYCVLCTVYCVLCTVYCVLCTVYCVLCTVYCVLCTVYCVLCTVYLTKKGTLCTLSRGPKAPCAPFQNPVPGGFGRVSCSGFSGTLGFIFFYTKNYVKTKSYRCAYMGRPPLVVRQMRGMKRKAAKGAGLCCSTGLES